MDRTYFKNVLFCCYYYYLILLLLLDLLNIEYTNLKTSETKTFQM